MNTNKKTGIWMDHSNAHLIQFASETIEPTTIDSAFTHQAKEESFGKSEHLMHNKEQHEQAAYYKSLSTAIKGYDEVLLFGPTTAKEELANLLKEDHLFDHIKINVEHADKMTKNQMQAFVSEYFARH